MVLLTYVMKGEGFLALNKYPEVALFLYAKYQISAVTAAAAPPRAAAAPP